MNVSSLHELVTRALMLDQAVPRSRGIGEVESYIYSHAELDDYYIGLRLQSDAWEFNILGYGCKCLYGLRYEPQRGWLTTGHAHHVLPEWKKILVNTFAIIKENM